MMSTSFGLMFFFDWIFMSDLLTVGILITKSFVSKPSMEVSYYIFILHYSNPSNYTHGIVNTA